MTDPLAAWEAGVLVGVCGGFLSSWICRAWMERRDPFTHWWPRSPYSLSKIWLAATKEDADKVAWEDPPEPMTVKEWARRGWTPYPTGRIVDAYGRTVGYIPRSRGGTSNPPPEAP